MNENYNTEYVGPMKRLSNEDFGKLVPNEARGLPEYFTVLNSGQILIWPALDTAQVIFECKLT